MATGDQPELSTRPERTRTMNSSLTHDSPANPSPSGHFDFSVFGAVSTEEIKGTKPARVEINEARRAAFAQLVSYFSAQPNTTKRSLTLPTDEAAEQLKAELQTYADERGTDPKSGKPLLTVAFPKHIAAHTVPERTKGDGTVVPAHDVADNKYPDHWNKSTNVTFRFVALKVENRNGPVTVTNVAAVADASKAGADKSAAEAELAASKASK
jgi:hypothetical protein